MMGNPQNVFRAYLLKFRAMLVQCRKKQQLTERNFVQGALVTMKMRHFTHHTEPDRCQLLGE